MNRRRHDRGSRDNESTDQMSGAGHLLLQQEQGALGTAERSGMEGEERKQSLVSPWVLPQGSAEGWAGGGTKEGFSFSGDVWFSKRERI